MHKKFLALLAKLGIDVTGKSEAEIQAAMAAAGISDDVPTPVPAPVPPPLPGSDVAQQIQAAIAPLQQQVQGLTAMLEAEKSGRATAQAALEAQQAADRQAQIATTLDEAVKAGRLEAAKKDAWKARLEKDFDGVKAILDEMPSATAPKSGEGTGKPSTTTPAVRTGGALAADVSGYLATALASNPTAASA